MKADKITLPSLSFVLDIYFFKFSLCELCDKVWTLSLVPAKETSTSVQFSVKYWNPPFLGGEGKNHTSAMTHKKITHFNHGHALRLQVHRQTETAVQPLSKFFLNHISVLLSRYLWESSRFVLQYFFPALRSRSFSTAKNWSHTKTTVNKVNALPHFSTA